MCRLVEHRAATLRRVELFRAARTMEKIRIIERAYHAHCAVVPASDQLALVTWFQQIAPPAGFGLGAIPWCGYGGSTGCPGVPAQVQSDCQLSFPSLNSV